VLREGAGSATQWTTEARSEVQVGRTTSKREERGASGASGACNGREQGTSKRAERRVGARWEKDVVANKVRRGVRMGRRPVDKHFHYFFTFLDYLRAI
jgi:hypothetical protein